MNEQAQFLEVLDRDEAWRRFSAALALQRLPAERVPLDGLLGRVLAADVCAPTDVPGFDRSNVDGYAVQARDTFGAQEERPRRLHLLDAQLHAGCVPQTSVQAGRAVPIATGGMLPRGADAVVMVEHAEEDGTALVVRRAVVAGANLTWAGTDIGRGETVLRRGDVLTSRETGVLAALGLGAVDVVRRPRVAILSTGDELLPPGAAPAPARVFDSNSRVLADAVRELGGQPHGLGIVGDDLPLLRAALQQALAEHDLVLISGGTSKGQGDVSYRAVAELTAPGIVAHGVALKPGKPVCLAASQGRAVVVLPGFPASALFTFHEFVAPVLLKLGGRAPPATSSVDARLAVKLQSAVGRTEFVLVGLTQSERGLSAYPLGKGSGSVTAFSRADGFLTIDRHAEIVPAGAPVRVQLLGDALRLPDLTAIGSHCTGLDRLLGGLQEQGWQTKFLAVGSTGGLAAAAAGQCDVAGIHLFDPATGVYNAPFLPPHVRLLPGYRRTQGLLFRPGDERFAHASAVQAAAAVRNLPDCAMVNRNPGSGTRVLIDRLLEGAQPPGYAACANSHNAVAAAIAQGRADWGLAIEHVARAYGLAFLPLADEHYDFAVPAERWERPAVAALRALLENPRVQAELAALGCRVQNG